MGALADWIQHRDDGVSRVRLELTVLGVLRCQIRWLLAGACRKDVEEIRDSRLRVMVVPHFVVAVCHCPPELLQDAGWIFEQIDDACVTIRRLRHLVLWVLEIHDSRTDLWCHCSGNDERLTESSVEAKGDVACDLDVLSLVVTNGDFVGVVEQDVRGLERWIGEESCRDEFSFAACRLVLELGHSAQFAVTHETLHHPAQLVVLRYVGLHEDGGNLRVEADGKKDRGQVQGALAEDSWLVRHGEGMEVDDAVVHVSLMLTSDPVP